MTFIGSAVGLGFSWGTLLQSAAGAFVGAVIAIGVNESWKAIKRYREKKKPESDG